MTTNKQKEKNWRCVQPNRADDLTQDSDDDEAEYVDATEVDVDQVESLIAKKRWFRICNIRKC